MRFSAERFLRKTLNAAHTQFPRVINVDKNAAYPPTVGQLQADEQPSKTTQLRQEVLGLKQKSSPNIAQTSSISSKYIAIMS